MAVEQVNQDILKILGLEETDEIDMKSYKGFLREKLVEISMGKGNLSRDEELVVQSEFQRVKKQSDTIKVKKKKISARDIKITSPSSALVKYKKPSTLSKEVKQTEPTVESQGLESGDKTIGDNLKSINKTLDKILKSIVSQGESDRKRREKERVSSERNKSQERESGLEKPLQIAKNLVNKIIAPFRGILDSVFRFLQFTFIGWLIGKFEDIQKWTEQNKEKIAVVTRFLKDWWPTLLGAYVLFATPFGAFVRSTLKMMRFFIPQIVRLMAAHPILAGATLATIGGIAKIKESERMKPLVEKNQAEIDKTLESKNAPWYQKLGAGFASQSLNAPGGPANPIGLQAPGGMYNRGGSIFGFNNGAQLGNYLSGIVTKNDGATVSGFGKDTQMFPVEGGGTAVLQPGETILQVGARERMIKETGHDPLSFNIGPNANRPMNFTYKGGGIIGMQGGGILGALGKFLPGTGTVMSPKGASLGYQDKFLGFNIGSRREIPLSQTYSPQSVQRYNQSSTAPSTLKPLQYGPLLGRHISLPKEKNIQFSTSTRTSPSTNSNLNLAIQNARDITNLPGGAAYRPLVENTGTVAVQQQRYYDELRKAMKNAGMSGYKESMNLQGKPIRRQGGGIIPQGPFTPLPAPGYVRPQGSFIPKPILALPGPMPGTTVPFGYDPFKGLKGGGVIRRQSGGSIPRGTAQFGEIPLIRAAMNYGIKGSELAAFLSQMSHETGGFKWSKELGRGEGMGYSGGSRYHGRGYTQLTHDYNYKHFGEKLGVDLLKDPDILLKDPNLSARVAIEYWKEKVRPNVKDWNDVFSHSAAINYPSATSPNQIRGYDDRVKKFEYYNKNLKNIVSRSLETKPQPKPKSKSPSLFENISGFFGDLFGGSAKASPLRKQGGGARFMNLGRVTTETGIDIPGGITGADTQYIPSLNTAVQPGEDIYVVPKQAVPEMDSMVAALDPNSNPAKNQTFRGDSLKRNKPNVAFINLPDKVISTPSGAGGGLSPGKPQLPEFDVIMDSLKRSEVASALGILDLL
jgi:predicted chitinase